MPALCTAVSKAPSSVGPGVGFAPPLVPSHLWAPLPSPESTGWTSVVTLPSNNVVRMPSIRTLTVTGWALAVAGASAAATATRSTRAPERVFMISLPFREGFVACRPEAGLLAPGFAWPRLPGERRSPVALHAAGLAGHSGGTAPDLHRTSLEPPAADGVSIHPPRGAIRV